MAGRGARPHIKPPPKPFTEVSETWRLIKTGADALERRESELAQKWKEKIAKQWTKKSGGFDLMIQTAFNSQNSNQFSFVSEELLTRRKTIWPDGSSYMLTCKFYMCNYSNFNLTFICTFKGLKVRLLMEKKKVMEFMKTATEMFSKEYGRTIRKTVFLWYLSMTAIITTTTSSP
jgi:hypothetical protein